MEDTLKTWVNLSLDIRIACDSSGNDVATKDFVIRALLTGKAVMQESKNGTIFIVWKLRNDQILGIIETHEITDL